MRTERRNKHGETWDEARDRIARETPSHDMDRWANGLNEDQLAKIIKDVLRAGHAHASKGWRPQPDENDISILRDMIELEYTTLPFVEAFRILAGERSLNHLSSRTGIDRYRIHRLITGRYEPTGGELETIARTFKKDPRYFCEYRSTLIAAAVMRAMDSNPDQSAAIARRIEI